MDAHTKDCTCERCWRRMFRRMNGRPEAFGAQFKARLLRTLEEDPEFRHDLRLVLGMREGERFYELWPTNYVADAAEPAPKPKRRKTTIRLGDADA